MADEAAAAGAVGGTDGAAAGAAGAAGVAGGAAGAAGGAQAPFYDGFQNPDVKAWAASKNFKDPEAIAQSAWHYEKLHGVPADQLLRLPKPGADFAEFGPVFDKMGRPKDAAGYKITVPEGMPDTMAKAAAPWFHEAGLTQAQVERVVGKWNEHIVGETKKANDDRTAKHTAAVKALETEWGAEHQSRSALADRAAAVFGMTKEQLVAMRDAMGPADAMKFLYSIGSKLGTDDKIINGDGRQQNFGGMTPAEAQAEISRLLKDKAFAAQFNNPDVANRERGEARALMDKLHKAAYPAS